MERDYTLTKNRELSWLQFNERVMDEATIGQVPLMERLKFLAIFCSNLDEFFMIRVGSLHDLMQEEDPHIDKRSGMSVEQQLSAIYKEVKRLILKKDVIYSNIINELEFQGVHILNINALTKEQKKKANEFYEENIKPIVSPMVIDAYHPFPHLLNKKLYVVSLLKNKNGLFLGITSVMKNNRLIEVGEQTYILSEQLILAKCDKYFSNFEVIDKAIISVTRNGDVDASGEILDQMDDYRSHMKAIIKKRNRLEPVRLEIQGNLSDKTLELLTKPLGLKSHQVFNSNSPLELSYVYSLAKKLEKTYTQFFYPTYTPSYPRSYDPNESMINQILKKDMLLFYPYRSTTPFLRLLKNAAEDDRVLSIKITLYRLANPSKVVDYLCQAAENGKSVTVLIELKARFDEANNIDWAGVLEESGCNVMYGFDDIKVHSKLCLITLKHNHHIQHIVQVATGNYNEKTAKLYTDLCLMTSNPKISDDAVNFFNNMAQGNDNGSYHDLLVAPNHLKDVIIKHIDQQIALGSNGYIFMKINSLSDIDIIDKFIEASQAGVKVDLIIRGICCLVPGISGKTENITIHSIVGRYLEHARIYVFGQKGKETMYISSADMMTRNTMNRVEVACPIYDLNVMADIYRIIDISLKDNVGARNLGSDGLYHHIPQNDKPINSQEAFMNYASSHQYQGKSSKKSVFDIFKNIFK